MFLKLILFLYYILMIFTWWKSYFNKVETLLKLYGNLDLKFSLHFHIAEKMYSFSNFLQSVSVCKLQVEVSFVVSALRIPVYSFTKFSLGFCLRYLPSLMIRLQCWHVFEQGLTHFKFVYIYVYRKSLILLLGKRDSCHIDLNISFSFSYWYLMFKPCLLMVNDDKFLIQYICSNKAYYERNIPV